MKTRTLTILLLCFIAFSTTFATKPIPASEVVRATVVELVKKSLCYPLFAIQNKTECCVLVSIIIQEDGALKVDVSNSVSPELMKYVVQTIEVLKEERLAQYHGQRVLMKVNFNLIA